MKILITGGAGFIGSHVADACVNEGHRVIIVDNLSTGYMENINTRSIFVKMDIRDEGITDLFRSERFDVVIHHAAQMDVRKSVDDPKFDASVNIVGSINLLESAVKFGASKFIFASTGGAIYGEQDYFPADEAHPLRPLSPYGIAKLSVEKYLFYYKSVYGLKYVSLRYSNVYGPRQNPYGEAGVVAIFINKMLRGENPVINGDGKQTRDYTFVSDVVVANMSAIGFERSGTFNVGTGIETDVNQLFRHIKELCSSSFEERHGPAKKGEQLRSVLDYAHIKKILGWQPSVSVADGIELTVKHFREKIDK